MTRPPDPVIVALADRAAATKLCNREARADVAKVLSALRLYEAARAIEVMSDEDYAAVIARAVGPATGPKTPKGVPIDSDAEDLPKRPP
jgi:hypothetical protein